MTWLVALGAVVGLVALTVLMLRRPKRRVRVEKHPAPSDTLGLSEADAAELRELERQLEQEYGVVRVQLLMHRLAGVVHRDVPLRAVRPGPVRGLARMCFADGTTVQVRGRQAGDLGYLAATAITRTVRISDFHAEQSSVVVDLNWDRGRVSVLAIGLDQAD
ncbi:MAG: hypothetical protein QM619_00790 [Micropruina sp.]|uniref:hypothetical protein n=1 Tax=Micropruina sp. TaxID=2737536 RepID=UPI0039E56103